MIKYYCFGLVLLLWFSSCSSCNKKASCPAYDNFASDQQNTQSGEDGAPPKFKKRKRKKDKSKKNMQKGLYGRRGKDNFKKYKPPKK